MTSEHISQLPQKIPIYTGRIDFVVNYATQKNVLHLGCVDQGVTQDKYEQGKLLHDKLQIVSKSLWGIDIDEVGINWLRAKGYPNLYQADLENLTSIPALFTQKFDLIIITEVLEHLRNPGLVLDQVYALFNLQTEMIITVPNSTSLNNLLYMLNGKELVHPDHNYWFSYTTINTLLRKHGYKILDIALYTQIDYQKSLLRYLIKRVMMIFNYRIGSGKLTNSIHTLSPPKKIRRFPRIGAWILLVLKTNIYRYLLKRNPFFADGLILIVRPTDK